MSFLLISYCGVISNAGETKRYFESDLRGSPGRATSLDHWHAQHNRPDSAHTHAEHTNHRQARQTQTTAHNDITQLALMGPTHPRSSRILSETHSNRTRLLATRAREHFLENLAGGAARFLHLRGSTAETERYDLTPWPRIRSKRAN